jgi:hypothetical protein
MMIVQVIAHYMFDKELTFQHNMVVTTAIVHDGLLQKYD